MEDQNRERENRIGSASQVIIAVAVVAVTVAVTELKRFHVALILLLVNPTGDVLMAQPRRFLSADLSKTSKLPDALHWLPREMPTL